MRALLGLISKKFCYISGVDRCDDVVINEMPRFPKSFDKLPLRRLKFENGRQYECNFFFTSDLAKIGLEKQRRARLCFVK